ncbi:MAG TPA: RNase adapter RapZ [Candidatus Acidoferrales bacterium]|nr:RNase adapter RapZ [Candidatus Acidoferrales bacterium]
MARRAEPQPPAGSPNATGRRLVLLTGLSGSGKGSVLRAFEDLGYYCVDNLPVELIPNFSELFDRSEEGFARVALLVDAREGEKLRRLPGIYRHLRRSHNVRLVFIEAGDEALIRRFSETRRPHPLGRGGSVREAVRRERRLMEPIRKIADAVLDTTRFNVHELRQFITERFLKPERQPLMVSVVSFGFRFGVPQDADLVFDVRFLPNPHFIPRFRPLTGSDRRVARYIRSFPQTRKFLSRVTQLLRFLLPYYIREGKSYLTIAIGCTGGRHRSVMMAEAIGRSLGHRGAAVRVVHRDVDRSAS